MALREDPRLFTKCTQYAMNYINRFPKTKKELTAKLYEKGYNLVEVEKTIEYLESKDFVNDALFAESYINSEVIKKWKPFWVIKQKLWQKWIEKEILDNVFSENEEDINRWMIEGIKIHIKKYKQKGDEWFDIIQKVLKKWYKLDHVKQAIEERAWEE